MDIAGFISRSTIPTAPKDPPVGPPLPPVTIPSATGKYRVRAGHDSCVVEAATEDEAKQKFFAHFGIRSTKHAIEFTSV